VTTYDNQPPLPGDDDFGASLPTWPKPVGIISIVWGCLGFCCNVAGVGMLFFLPSMMGNTPEVRDNGGIPPAMAPTPITLGVAVVSALATTLLIVAGSMCVGRKPVTRPLHLVYALLSLAAIAMSVWNQMQIAAAMKQFAQTYPKNPLAQQGAGNIVSMVIGVFFFAAWPLFLLVWFGLVKRKPADITGVPDADGAADAAP